jgi:hypothetical protein
MRGEDARGAGSLTCVWDQVSLVNYLTLESELAEASAVDGLARELFEGAVLSLSGAALHL